MTCALVFVGFCLLAEIAARLYSCEKTIKIPDGWVMARMIEIEKRLDKIDSWIKRVKQT